MTGRLVPPKGAGRWYLVCYDIRDPKRLRRVANILEGHGERIQYSVFRCWLSPSALERLRWELTDGCVTEEDDVLFIPLCSRCVGESESRIAPSRTVRGRRAVHALGSCRPPIQATWGRVTLRKKVRGARIDTSCWTVSNWIHITDALGVPSNKRSVQAIPGYDPVG